MKDVAASGNGVKSDAVQFLAYGTKSDNTFTMDLPNGLYEVKVTLGNTARASVAAEGVYQVINMTGDGAEDTFQIPVTDGQLNLLVTEGKAGTNFTLSALKIKKMSEQPVTNRTIYVGGDSTVCNYYPLNSSKQAGWGQMLPQFMKKNAFQVRNMASGGQFARGFRDNGQLEAILKYIKPGDYFILQLGMSFLTLLSIALHYLTGLTNWVPLAFLIMTLPFLMTYAATKARTLGKWGKSV